MIERILEAAFHGAIIGLCWWGTWALLGHTHYFAPSFGVIGIVAASSYYSGKGSRS